MANVLITGTSSGIGLQTAIGLATAGHTVFATMRNTERGAALRKIVDENQLPVSILEMDVDSIDRSTPPRPPFAPGSGALTFS